MTKPKPKWTRGPRGYARIIGLLSSGPVAVPELRDALHTSDRTVRSCMRGLAAQGLVQRVGGERPEGRRGVPSSVWALGGAPNANRCRVEMIAFGHFMRALHAGPVTTRELILASGFCRHTINRILKQLRREGLVHIGTWDRIAHLPTPAFVYGPGANVTRPKPTPQAVISRNWAEAQLAKREQMQVLNALAANAGDFMVGVAA